MAKKFEIYTFQHNDWIDGEKNINHRSELYGEIVNQYFRYLNNVMYQIGGIRLSQVKRGYI